MRREKFDGSIWIHNGEGSPPHAQGKERDTAPGKRLSRITPACAGKSMKPSPRVSLIKDHPRMRREKSNLPARFSTAVGSPPHAQGKVQIAGVTGSETRITPACAGKRLKKIPNYKHFQNRTHQISFSFKNTLYSVSQSGNALCNSQEMPKNSAKDPNL